MISKSFSSKKIVILLAGLLCASITQKSYCFWGSKTLKKLFKFALLTGTCYAGYRVYQFFTSDDPQAPVIKKKKINKDLDKDKNLNPEENSELDASEDSKIEDKKPKERETIEKTMYYPHDNTLELRGENPYCILQKGIKPSFFDYTIKENLDNKNIISAYFTDERICRVNRDLLFMYDIVVYKDIKTKKFYTKASARDFDEGEKDFLIFLKNTLPSCLYSECSKEIIQPTDIVVKDGVIGLYSYVTRGSGERVFLFRTIKDEICYIPATQKEKEIDPTNLPNSLLTPYIKALIYAINKYEKELKKTTELKVNFEKKNIKDTDPQERALWIKEEIIETEPKIEPFKIKIRENKSILAKKIFLYN